MSREEVIQAFGQYADRYFRPTIFAATVCDIPGLSSMSGKDLVCDVDPVFLPSATHGGSTKVTLMVDF